MTILSLNEEVLKLREKAREDIKCHCRHNWKIRLPVEMDSYYCNGMSVYILFRCPTCGQLGVPVIADASLEKITRTMK